MFGAYGPPRRNAKVVFLSSIFNDANNPGLTLAQYKAQLQTIIQRIVSRPSSPVVVLIVPLRPDFAVVSHDLARFEALRSAIYEVQAEFVGQAILLDYGAIVQNSGWNGLSGRRGLLSSDKLHLSDRGHLSSAHEWLMLFSLAAHL